MVENIFQLIWRQPTLCRHYHLSALATFKYMDITQQRSSGHNSAHYFSEKFQIPSHSSLGGFFLNAAMRDKNTAATGSCAFRSIHFAKSCSASSHFLAQAESCFDQALAISRKQQAKSLELRAATSMARLWQQQGRQDDARHILEEIYNWFTEGFDTHDLQEAAILIRHE